VTASGIEELSREECERLLAGQNLGRVAIVIDGHPQIFPVNYAYQDGIVVFRSALGVKAERSPMSSVAFETDMVDTASGTAWSVMVEGTAQDITKTIDPTSERLRHLVLEPAAPGDRRYWIGVYVAKMSGRRFSLPGQFVHG
jgi:nitroimidazol reductase NimA-like FMN-containing flavoprotein (pyridoxamine 5'-phosphate oxidase superfamily)